MTCDGSKIDCLLTAPENSDEFKQCVAHVDHCEKCQLELDAWLQADSATRELAQTLATAEPEDLAIPSFALREGSPASNLSTAGESSDETFDDTEFLLPASHPELLGRLGRYDVERIIGRGGMGIVFRAYDSELHRVVALKVLGRHLTTTAAARQRFAREARAAAAVLHPNVLPIHDVEAGGPTPYLVMQYVSGCSLQTRVDRDGPLEPGDAMRIAKQTSEALAAAHHQGLIHRDVKPANILLEHGTDRVVLGDFGLARTSDDASLTRTGIVAGTPHYMSPEQAGGEPVSNRSDLFALGSVMYFMLTGQPPFRGESAMSVLNCVCTKKHVPLHEINPNVPRELSDLVDRLLSKKPSGRPASAEAASQRLEFLLGQLQEGNLRFSPSGSRRWLRTTLVGCVLIALALVLGTTLPWLMPRDNGENDSSVVAATESQPSASPRPSEFQADPVSPSATPAYDPASYSWRNLGWNDWEQSLQDTQASLDSENQIDAASPRLSAVLLAPDPWSDELNAIAAELDRMQAEDAQDETHIENLLP